MISSATSPPLLTATFSAGAVVHYSKDSDVARAMSALIRSSVGIKRIVSECRFDSDGSGPFTKREFVNEYGGYDEWDAVQPV